MVASGTRPGACPNEIALLLACARTRLDSAHADRVRALVAGGLDWSLVIDAASRHGLTPLLHRNLNAACPDDVPDSARTQLLERSLANARWNLYRTQELLRILRLLQDEGIAAIPFKGRLSPRQPTAISRCVNLATSISSSIRSMPCAPGRSWPGRGSRPNGG
jgi:hypothetical protein